MAEIIEEFFTGYCRNFDMTQTVICEFEQLPNGLIFWIQAANTETVSSVKIAHS